MNNRRTKYFWRIALSQLAIAAVMFVLGFVIVFYAQGLRFNLKNFKITKTGLVFLATNQKSAEVYINNKLISTKLPATATLLPGYYQVEIKKPGYKTWGSRVFIEEELVSDFRDIILFRENIETFELNDENKIKLLNTPIDLLAVNAESELNFNGYEIWVGNTLVTRLSEPIERAIWYPDLNHIIYERSGQIKIIEKSGQNDTLLVRLKQNAPTNFVVGSHGEELYFVDEGKYKTALIK